MESYLHQNLGAIIKDVMIRVVMIVNTKTFAFPLSVLIDKYYESTEKKITSVFLENVEHLPIEKVYYY